ncbi:MAG: hypothetical protein NC301_02710 [Bacteroides sp.]|nr:hypothetical protein [Bacteroides sp.]MCM1379643.1 hypothetical protein [Bacteroides sp.]MCM1445975.1 hypothetical protein [Prevotella sp.]
MIKYTDEKDKAYGLAGMAISLVAWDAEEWLESINLDAAPDEAMQMSTEFYLTLAPRVGAKALWEQAFKRFQLTAAMMVANVTCRELLNSKHANLSGESDSELRAALYEEGAELCSLEQDEVSRIYGKSLNYCTQLFSHPGVRQVASNLVDNLLYQRELSSDEVLLQLSSLNHI